MGAQQQCRIGKGAVAGLVGGLAAAWAMNEFQSLVSQAAARHEPRDNSQHKPTHEPATVKVAETLSRDVFGHPLSRPEKKLAGPAVHYGYGALIGGVYGALAEEIPAITAGFGTAYGSAAFLLGDELAVPALGLSPPPAEFPVSKHAEALAAHLLYGAVLNAVCLALGE